MEDTKLKILTKLHAIMSEVGSIEKDKINTFHGYEYASEHAIKAALQPLLIKNKVMFQLECNGATVIKVEDPKNPGDIIGAMFIYHFYDIESGEEITGVFRGSGQDKGDKGIYKAITGAVKYILTSTFLIPTGDDPEKDQKQSDKQGSDKKIYQKPIQSSISSKIDGNCPQCGNALQQRKGKWGPFIGCSNYPECRYIQKNKPATKSNEDVPEFDDELIPSYPPEY